MKLIPNRGIKRRVDFASLLKQQAKEHIQMSLLVNLIISLSLYVTIITQSCVVLFYIAAPDVGGKNNIKLSVRKIAHALWLMRFTPSQGKKHTELYISVESCY